MQSPGIGDVANLLQVTTATIRNWLELLGDNYVSAGALRRTGKRFTPEDIAVLRKVQSLLTQGLTYAEIPDLLPARAEIFEEISPEAPQQALQALDLLERVEALLQGQETQYKAALASKDDLISELRQDKERLQNELDNARRSWLARLLGRDR